MTQYMLSVYQPEGPIPPPEVLEKISRELDALSQELKAAGVWGYVDGRDGAQAVLKALELDTTGFDRFIIAAADTVMSRRNSELVAETFPGVTVVCDFGEHDTLLSIDKARRVLGYSPQHSWR
jgi:nucleoside-diphosphate-sugar epimerase